MKIIRAVIFTNSTTHYIKSINDIYIIHKYIFVYLIINMLIQGKFKKHPKRQITTTEI